ncbi:hypothetical protein [Streptosporangium canum]|uniref:hypothetical protein n=1 Tax=Streptosporangium canum TaxID=324952 RepID=UPI00379706ED
MDPDNPVVRLCTQGMQAESQGRPDEARDLFLQAWKAAQDDYEACIAAHYLARHQPTPEETLHWNQECLDRADRVGDERVRGFYASLHGNMGRSHLELGQVDQAREHFLRAARRIDDLPAGQYGDWLRYCVAEGLRSTRAATAGGTADPVLEILGKLCARADLKALSLLLPAYMGDLGTADDGERITTALRMLHAERRLPADEQAAVSQAITARTAGV